MSPDIKLMSFLMMVSVVAVWLRSVIAEATINLRLERLEEKVNKE